MFALVFAATFALGLIPVDLPRSERTLSAREPTRVAQSPFDDAEDWQSEPERYFHVILQADVLLPRTVGFGSRDPAFGASVSLWNQQGPLAFQPRLGAQYGQRSVGYYLNVVVDAGIFLVPVNGLLKPFFGAGGGFRFVRIANPKSSVTRGAVIAATFESDPSINDAGLSGYLRVGAFIFDDGPVQIVVNGDYSVGWMGGDDRIRAAMFSAGVAF